MGTAIIVILVRLHVARDQLPIAADDGTVDPDGTTVDRRKHVL